MTDAPDHSRLCYLDAADVRGPLPSWDGVALRNHADEEIGQLDGIVIDPAGRHVHYLIVSATGMFRRHQYLLPFHPTRLDVEHQSLCVDLPKTALKQCEKFERAEFRRYSAEDLFSALFPDTLDYQSQSN
jgi:hypothetical protein